jgi:hypothetical protein
MSERDTPAQDEGQAASPQTPQTPQGQGAPRLCPLYKAAVLPLFEVDVKMHGVSRIAWELKKIQGALACDREACAWFGPAGCQGGGRHG